MRTIRAELQQFLQLAIPLAAAQVAQAAVGFVDTVMMGRLGPEPLAAGGLASALFQFILATASGVVMAVSPLVAEAQGAGKDYKIAAIARQGLWLSVLLGLPVMLIISQLARLMPVLGQSATTIALARDYWMAVLWGIIPGLGFAMLRGYVAALEQARIILPLVLFGTLVNGLGNYLLGYGQLGFPRLELTGLGLSSALGLWVMFLGLLAYTAWQPKLRRYPFWQDWRRLQPSICRQILQLGWAIAVTVAVEFGLFTIITILMGAIGVEALAAHQTVSQTIILIFMVPLGCSFAVTVRVGWWLGRQDGLGARRAGLVGVGAIALWMLLLAIPLALFPRAIVGIYVDLNNPVNAGLLNLALPMLRVASLALVLDGVQRVAMGALHGLQDTRIPLLLSLLAFWMVGVGSSAMLGFQLGWGSTGLWIGQSLGVAIAGGLFLQRFLKLTQNRTFKQRLQPQPLATHP
ncbi:MATE efflux family protein [Synechococcus elongatus PCC 7942 = FACHB-805]|uniref:Probable multidrug resistance protein NorM n=1 Tax=Synechococcus elongatus (strain ATCC 33912 / PCC 7942 / FACHB-805) TaxID=1140 RepID=Q31MJ0_SYNE7|nr:MATE family efflux transporter [Synechococcus elongatus]ABB57729.1 MATE efflux family protein [Synechococcus elongatus PCC 7942 = FACHB-805]